MKLWDRLCLSFLVLCGLTSFSVSGFRCETLREDSVCKPLLPYSNVLVPETYTPPLGGANVTGCQDQNEAQVKDLGPLAWSALPASCHRPLSMLMCSAAYPSCEAPRGPCRSLCEQVTQACRMYATGLSSLGIVDLECSHYPDEDCFAPTGAQIASVEPQYAKCVEYTGKACAGVVTWDVYVPAGMTLDDLEKV